jgi:hypothetical protein
VDESGNKALTVVDINIKPNALPYFDLNTYPDMNSGHLQHLYSAHPWRKSFREVMTFHEIFHETFFMKKIPSNVHKIFMKDFMKSFMKEFMKFHESS